MTDRDVVAAEICLISFSQIDQVINRVPNLDKTAWIVAEIFLLV